MFRSAMERIIIIQSIDIAEPDKYLYLQPHCYGTVLYSYFWICKVRTIFYHMGFLIASKATIPIHTDIKSILCGIYGFSCSA